jgi:uncharacterized protein (DUF983 family)
MPREFDAQESKEQEPGGADGGVARCPRCGEARLVEEVDSRRWFCGVCAFVWMTL